MEQRISLITLGVRDLNRARDFYQRLGWIGQEVQETVFLQAGGSALVLWGRDKLAHDSGVADDDLADGDAADGGRPGFDGIVLAQNVRSTGEVDAVLEDARLAGGTITKPAVATFYGGYAGCFADPDGHLWEIGFNPGFPLAADGSITIPDFGA